MLCRMMQRSFVRTMLCALVPIVVAISAAATSWHAPVEVRADAPVLDFAVDYLMNGAKPENLVTACAGVDRLLAARAGHEWTLRLDDVDEPGKTARATVWKSIEDAEEASLTLEGSPERKTFTGSADVNREGRLHFRQLREHVYSNDKCGHLEVVVFRTKPTVTREANVAKFDAAESEFEKGKGLRAHSLWIAPDGRWVHLLKWEDAAAFAQTGKALFMQPGVGGWIRSLDFKRFVVTRGDVVAVQ
jgi:hypothetical protein